ncbi:MAG: HEAT repeat domain-containing protein, partial [Bryobacteraceae bacterium]
PRRGGVYDRVSNVHQETSLCVACHATHFPQRAAVYAARNGYPVELRQQVQFMAERFYNNPRPFYGFEEDGAVWARVISAPANVLGRMSHLIDVYEKEISGERRESFHDGIRKYLELYYKDRDTLPADETNGNKPLVSTYEVAWYAWETTKDPAIARLIEQDQIKDMIDLCYQTQALAAIDRNKYAAKIAANAERILSLQRPSGQWAMTFEPVDPEVEFQTGHALWALQAAGIPADNPQVKKAIQYLLKRQQSFGGWMDPEQSYENFKTPFRETQMAVLALSSYFPLDGRRKGWNAGSKSSGVLDSLDQIWGPQPDSSMSDLQRKSESPDVLVRQQAIEALGRVASPDSLPQLIDRLGDPSKLVQRTAAWAVRQIYSRHPEVSIEPLKGALSSKSDRVRWGATRVFATHFAALAKHAPLADALSALAGDPVPAVRMQAVKGLWQFWFWTSDDAVKDGIEDVILAGLSKPQHPWVARNFREALYNLADENIRYLYNNWIPLLADAEDRERAIRGRLEVENRLARKIAGILETGSASHKKAVLAGLTEYHLRRSDVYEAKADASGPPPPVYNRIGNDIEQIVFFGETSATYSKALSPLITSDDPEMRRLALKGSLLARDTKFPTAVKIAGDPGPDRDQLLTAVLDTKDIAPELRKGLSPPDDRTKTARAPASAAPVQPESNSASGRPDKAYFQMHIRPILEAKGKDGYACVQCHATHTLFNGSYETVLNVIDTENPENSLLLKKPTSSAETEGTLRSRTTAHGGGVRWETGSKEYNTILDWIRGAKP